MVKRYFRGVRINKGLGLLVLVLTVLQPACAQNRHTQNEAIVNEDKLLGQSVALFNNERGIVPVQNLVGNHIASLHFHYAYSAIFDSLLNKYARVTSVNSATIAGANMADALTNALKPYQTVVIELSTTEQFDPQLPDIINYLGQFKQVIVVLFGNAPNFTALDSVSTPMIWCPILSAQSAAYAAQVVFGGIGVSQQTSVALSAKYQAGSGFLTAKIRLQYAVPEEAGINPDNLAGIDRIARDAIEDHATPGCVVLVAKDGKVIFNKAYGHHTYDGLVPDKISDIFDLASVTKITATTMEVMQLYDENKLALDSTMGHYVASARFTNKNDIKVRELLLHQAGLVPYIPFYEALKPYDHSRDSSASYPTKVADGYYLRAGYFNEVMWPEMLATPLRTRGKYVYSDLSMYFTRAIVEAVSGTPLNIYAQQHFYDPLGMQSAGFLPHGRFSLDRIVPTEIDNYFRMTLIHGYVHDQGAAMAGGVSGHAGVFASSNDIAILFQMMLNGGTYGGAQYIKPGTIDLFTAKQSNVSRRGLGFDRWDPDTTLHYPARQASPQTYGHTGYTGIGVWVDPKYNLIYIFLSNRVYPKVTDRLSQLHIRARILDEVYTAINTGL